MSQGTQRGRSRSRSPVGPRDRDIARHPHPYHNPRYSSDSHTDGRRSQRGSEYESRYYDREYMPPPPEGHYTTPPSQSYNYPSRDTWGTAYPPYGDGPSHSHMDPGRNPDPQPVNPHQSFGSMQPQEPSFDVGFRFSVGLTSPCWTDLNTSQDYYRKILDAVKNAQLTQTHAATTHSQHR